MTLSKPHAICQLFKHKWEERFGESYFIIKGRDHKFANDLVDVPMDEITRRLGVFLSDHWYIENAKCSLPSFVKNFNSFIPLKNKQKKAHACLTCNQTFEDYGEYLNHGHAEDVPAPREFTAALEGLTARSPANPNEQYRCGKCQTIHSPKLLCGK